MKDGTLLLKLLNGRQLSFREARLIPGKFEGTRNLQYKDNAKGGWTDFRAWKGVLIENLVQATARDLLAAAIVRLETAGYPVALHVHDEIICEIPEDFGSLEEFHHDHCPQLDRRIADRRQSVDAPALRQKQSHDHRSRTNNDCAR
jgi:DNA polymerase